MGSLAIELNDAAIAVVHDGAVLSCEPGYAVTQGGDIRFGAEARKLAWLHPRQAYRRFWRELSDSPLAQPAGALRSAADFAHAHLEQIWSRCPPGPVNLVVPAYWSTPQLALLLGIAKDVGMPVAGLVDSAVAASRRPYEERDLWHLEASSYDLCLTQIGQGANASVGARERIERLGIEALERVCAEFVARRFVATSRFDPLHDAASEQSLYDHLGDWLAGLRRRETAELELEHRGVACHAAVSAAGMAEDVNLACQPLIQKLRALLPAGRAVTLQVSHRLTEFPGLVEDLRHLPDVVVVAIEPAAAARGAYRLRASAAEDGFRLVTALPWDQPPVAPAGGPGAAPAAMPTHVLYQGRAYRLGAAPFQIGTELAEGEFGVALDGRVSGISRRHCAVRVEGGRVLVHDQSRHGTLLNGHRIDSVAVLQAGDVIGIGQPAREFQLIAEVTSDAA